MDKEIKWTNLSLKEISKAFESKGMNISPHVVKQLLKKHGFVERKMQKAVTMKDCKDSSHNKLCTSPIVRLDFHNQGRQSKFQ